jgi:hypothetical protein
MCFENYIQIKKSKKEQQNDICILDLNFYFKFLKSLSKKNEPFNKNCPKRRHGKSNGFS